MFLGEIELLYFTFSLAQPARTLNTARCFTLRQLIKLSTSTLCGGGVAVGKLTLPDSLEFVGSVLAVLPVAVNRS